jgi:hypothetical protein
MLGNQNVRKLTQRQVVYTTVNTLKTNQSKSIPDEKKRLGIMAVTLFYKA